jgi:myo-inositol 2-dehydrogenase / D-chiro-inositol 1-dehydrogenase
MRDVGVGLVGAGFVAGLHAAAFEHVPSAQVLAVASATDAHARRFAAEHNISSHYSDYQKLLEDDAIAVISVALPNQLHRDVVVAAASAGKHVICEKPLARTLAEADEMIAACEEAGVLLMYAEELCFAPKYVRAKELVDEGALGRVFMVQQGEQHFGPHSDWFWDVERSGGGVLMDMGCHAIEFSRWIYDKPAVESVTAELGTFVHADRTVGEDHAIATVRFEGNRVGLIETSWAKRGGMDDRAEILGSGGVAYVDLLRGSALLTYSEGGYGYAVEKAPDTRGWTFAMFEELWNYGFPQEMRHFIECVQHSQQPLETGIDGRAVLEILYGMYRAAGSEGRVQFPLELDGHAANAAPVAEWLDERKAPAGSMRASAGASKGSP